MLRELKVDLSRMSAVSTRTGVNRVSIQTPTEKV